MVHCWAAIEVDIHFNRQLLVRSVVYDKLIARTENSRHAVSEFATNEEVQKERNESNQLLKKAQLQY